MITVMSMLEEKIKRNRDVLDGQEPSEGHFDRFQEKLSALHEGERQNHSGGVKKLLRVAAVIAVLTAISSLIYLMNPAQSPDRVTASVLPPEVHEARLYYDQLVDEKLQKIDECAVSNSEASFIRKMIIQEITLLDSNTVQLEQELQKDKQNTRLINAIIRNYKTKSDLVENILNRLCHI